MCRLFSSHPFTPSILSDEKRPFHLDQISHDHLAAPSSGIIAYNFLQAPCVRRVFLKHSQPCGDSKYMARINFGPKVEQPDEPDPLVAECVSLDRFALTHKCEENHGGRCNIAKHQPTPIFTDYQRRQYLR
jgi:hypothetical protein